MREPEKGPAADEWDVRRFRQFLSLALEYGPERIRLTCAANPNTWTVEVVGDLPRLDEEDA